MKKYIISSLIILAWVTCLHSFSNHSFLTYRSQSLNGARSIVGWQELRNELFAQCKNGNLSLALEYTRSFDACALNNYFFGAQCLTFSGSRVANRGATDIMADYFGLPTDFQSTLCFKPIVQNGIVDVDWYWNLPTCATLYLRLQTALVHTQWNLNPCETIRVAGELDYPAGYMDIDRIDRNQLPASALQTLSGNAIYGDMNVPLQYGKICGKQTKTALADILVAVGYTPIACDSYHLGFDLHTVIPTGTRSCARNLFEAQIGNGHHWAIGASITAHYDFSSCDDWGVGVYLDGYVQHLFASYQKRSFDFCENGPGSRYMLISNMPKALDVPINFTGTTTELEQQYTGQVLHAIDKTTFNTKIKINAQADIVLKLAARWCNWTADIGYNFWARTPEELVCRDRLQENQYAIKGDAQLYGYAFTGEPGLNPPVTINATQSHATIHSGQGAGNTTMNFTNDNADNPQELMLLFFLPLNQTLAESVGPETGVTSLDLINGSNQAILLSDDNINNGSGLSPRALSNKIFGHINYTWSTECHAIPYIGVGAEGEFSGKICGLKTAVSQWGIWIKGGVTY